MKDENSEEEFSNSLELIDEFLKNNRHLFELLGIFGAIAVYLSIYSIDFNSGTIPASNLGSIASFSITGFIMIVIFLNLSKSVYSSNYSILNIRSLPIVIFGLLFLFLGISITQYVLNFNRTIETFIALITYIVAIILFLYILKLLDILFNFDRDSYWIVIFLIGIIIFYVLNNVIINTQQIINQYSITDPIAGQSFIIFLIAVFLNTWKVSTILVFLGLIILLGYRELKHIGII